MLLEVEGARSAVLWAAWALDNEPETAGIATHVAKAYASDCAARVTESSLQVHGGIGFTWEHDLHFFLKRAQANAHAYGDARWHRDRVADLRGHLSPSRPRAGDVAATRRSAPRRRRCGRPRARWTGRWSATARPEEYTT